MSTQEEPCAKLVKITSRQLQVLSCIRDYFEANGRPPTIREIGKLLGITSTNGVADHLQALESKGLIAVDRNVSRGIRILQRQVTP